MAILRAYFNYTYTGPFVRMFNDNYFGLFINGEEFRFRSDQGDFRCVVSGCRACLELALIENQLRYKVKNHSNEKLHWHNEEKPYVSGEHTYIKATIGNRFPRKLFKVHFFPKDEDYETVAQFYGEHLNDENGYLFKKVSYVVGLNAFRYMCSNIYHHLVKCRSSACVKELNGCQMVAFDSIPHNHPPQFFNEHNVTYKPRNDDFKEIAQFHDFKPNVLLDTKNGYKFIKYTTNRYVCSKYRSHMCGNFAVTKEFNGRQMVAFDPRPHIHENR